MGIKSYRGPPMPISVLASPCAICSIPKAASDVPARLRTPVEAAAYAPFAVPAAELGRTAGGEAPVGFARQSAIYLAHLAFGSDLSGVGRAFGRDQATAAYACRRVEDRREG